MKYKLIVSDFDGTMAINGVVSPSVIKSINKYRANGGKFVMCTGRARVSANSVINKNAIQTDAVISLQGALCEVDGTKIIHGGIPKRVIYDMLLDIRSFGLGCVIWQDDNLFYENDKNSLEYVSYFKDTDVVPLPLNNESQILDSEKDVFGKIVINKTPAHLFEKIISFINEKYGEYVVANSGASYLVEIVSKNYTKYQTTKKLAAYFGFNENEVITVGDSTNDLTLLNYGFGIAVGNAESELKKVAKYIAPSVEENAISFIVDKALNNEEFI